MRPLLLLIGTGAVVAAAALSLMLLMLMLILWQWCGGGAGAHVGADVDSARINLSIHRQTICCSLSSLEYLSRAECDEWSYAGSVKNKRKHNSPCTLKNK